jgi:hypothetical protein
MDRAERWKRAAGRIALQAALAAALGGGAALSGCGLPGAPLPPSLKLPDPVTDLDAARTGGQVSLTWTMPVRDTDKVLLKGDVAVRVCRRESAAAPCAAAGSLTLKPAASGTFTDTLPAALAEGPPRALRYFVELVNKRGRSAGLSNAATVLAGEAPAAVTGLSAEVRKEGVVLRWTPGPQEPYPTAVRLQRTLPTPAAKTQSEPQHPQAQGLLAPPPEPVEQNLLVRPSGVRGRAIDEDIRFGETYAYRAQRVARLTVDGKTLELDGPLSAAVRVEALNVFAPAVPAGLAAVATPGENGGAASIDLSWMPDSEADVAGYAVYRREAGGAWRRISSAEPVAGPGFHDANVEAGHTYEYAVTAIGQNGRESERSAAAEETTPGP